MTPASSSCRSAGSSTSLSCPVSPQPAARSWSACCRVWPCSAARSRAAWMAACNRGGALGRTPAYRRGGAAARNPSPGASRHERCPYAQDRRRLVPVRGQQRACEAVSRPVLTEEGGNAAQRRCVRQLSTIDRHAVDPPAATCRPRSAWSRAPQACRTPKAATMRSPAPARSGG